MRPLRRRQSRRRRRDPADRAARAPSRSAFREARRCHAPCSCPRYIRPVEILMPVFSEADDRPHRPDDDPLWQESRLFVWQDREAGVGGFWRLGLEPVVGAANRSEEHTSELQSLMRISYAVFCLKKKKDKIEQHTKPHY